MMVNVVREKQKTNIRTHAADEAIKLTPPRGAHPRDGHRVHRRRRAGRGHARRASASASGCSRSRTAAASPAEHEPCRQTRDGAAETLVRLRNVPGIGRRGARCLHSSSSPTAFPSKRRLVDGARGRGLPEGSPKHSTARSRLVAAPGSGGPVVGQPLGSRPTSATTFIPSSSTPLISAGTTTGSRTRPCGPSTTTSSVRPCTTAPGGTTTSASTDASRMRSLSPHAPGAAVWIHDYHLQLVPSMVRERRPDLRIGFFLHIPFPPADLFARLPWRSEVLDGIAGADLIGFQTPARRGQLLRSRGAARRDPTGTITCVGHSAASESGPIPCRSTTSTGTTSLGSPKSRSASSSCVATSAIRTPCCSASIGSTTRRASSTGSTRSESCSVEGRLTVPEAVLVQVASPSRDRVDGVSQRAEPHRAARRRDQRRLRPRWEHRPSTTSTSRSSRWRLRRCTALPT